VDADHESRIRVIWLSQGLRPILLFSPVDRRARNVGGSDCRLAKGVQDGITSLPMSNGVTMKTIALQAGVTQATVSLSLANNPRISVATRGRIHALAKKLGYQPNPYVSTLMRVRRQGKPLGDKPVLALVCAQHTADGWRTHPSLTIRQMRDGAFERATLRGYQAQEFWLHRDGMSNERFSEMLYARGIRGLLLSPACGRRPVPRVKLGAFRGRGS
jgi:hypothetical protein